MNALDRLALWTWRLDTHLPAWTRWGRRITELEIRMSEQTTRTNELNEGLTALSNGLDELSTRIEGLDDDPNNITAEQIAQVKALGARVNGLAVAAPEIPTPDAPVEPSPAEPDAPIVPAEPTA